MKYSQANTIILYMDRQKPGIYPVTKQQGEVIKKYWMELHEYTKAEYSFNESLTKIRKHDKKTRLTTIFY